MTNLSPSDRSAAVAHPPVDSQLILGAPRPHTLVVAPTARVEVTLARWYRRLQAPVLHWWPSSIVDAPRPPVGTLVVWGVDRLDRAQQQQLLAWLEESAGAVQLISVSEEPLFPLVLREEFLPELYYRLNTLFLTLH